MHKSILKKIFSYFIVGMLAMEMVSIAENGFMGRRADKVYAETMGDWEYEYRNGLYGPVSIIGYKGSKTDITIPDEIDGKSDIVIGENAFSKCDNVVSVEITENVTDIRPNAFFGCSNLKKIKIKGKIDEIESNTFSGCSSLESVEIPNSVERIDFEAFSGCSSLKKIELPDGVIEIRGFSFTDCNGLESIEIPRSVSIITANPFPGCDKLTRILVSEENTIFDSRENCNAIIYTGSNALLAGCKNTIIPESVTMIASYAFSDCSTLEKLVIPDSVKEIGENAFSGCNNLTIYSTRDAYAHTYAKENKIPWKDINELKKENNKNESKYDTKSEGENKVDGGIIIKTVILVILVFSVMAGIIYTIKIKGKVNK